MNGAWPKSVRGWCGFKLDDELRLLKGRGRYNAESPSEDNKWGGQYVARSLGGVLWSGGHILALVRGYGPFIEERDGWRCQGFVIEHLYVPANLYNQLPSWAADVPTAIIPPVCCLGGISCAADAAALRDVVKVLLGISDYACVHCEVGDESERRCYTYVCWRDVDKKVHAACIQAGCFVLVPGGRCSPIGRQRLDDLLLVWPLLSALEVTLRGQDEFCHECFGYERIAEIEALIQGNSGPFAPGGLLEGWRWKVSLKGGADS